MSDGQSGIALVEGEDGILVLGPAEEVEAFVADAPRMPRPISARALGRIAVAAKGAAAIQAQSGRYLKLDDASWAFVKSQKMGSVTSGVVRAKDVVGATGNGGAVVKHLTFTTAGLASPAGLAVLGAIVAQQALEASLAEITEYLEAIDAKLDQLLKARKVDALGELGGVAWVIDEAAAVYDETGRVSPVTWSKVQANALSLTTIQARAVAWLESLAEDVRGAAGDPDRLAKLLGAAGEEVAFWLGLLARTMALQDRQYVLELAYVEEMDPDELDAHRRGIRVAREQRTRRIAEALDAVGRSIRESTVLSNRQRVANPFSAPKVDAGSQAVNARLVEFLRHIDLGAEAGDHFDGSSWFSAAKGLFGETATQVEHVGAKIADQARVLGGHWQQRREDGGQSRASRLMARRKDRRVGADE